MGAIGYVPQQRALYRSLTISDHFVMARDEVVGELSGGEQAKVAFPSRWAPAPRYSFWMSLAELRPRDRIGDGAYRFRPR